MVWSGQHFLVSAVENVIGTQISDCGNIFFEFLQFDVFGKETMQIVSPLFVFIVYVTSVCPHLIWCSCYSVCMNVWYKV